MKRNKHLFALIICLVLVITACKSATNKNNSSSSSSSSVASNSSSDVSSGSSSDSSKSDDVISDKGVDLPSTEGTEKFDDDYVNKDPDIIVPTGAISTQKWIAYDITLMASKVYDNSYLSQAANATFTGPDGEKMTIPLYWDGGKAWRIRFAPPKVGKWTYVTRSADVSDTGLNNQTGTIYCTKYTGKLKAMQHGFLRVSDTKRYLTYNDGTPFFWLGEFHWDGLGLREKLYDSNSMEYTSMFKGMIDKRVEQGYTAYQTNFFVSASGDQTGDGTYNEGGSIWLDGDTWQKLNPEYFKNTDIRIKYIVNKGLIPALALDWGDKINKDNVNDYIRAARYIVARYAAYPVLWFISGEYSHATDPELWARVGEVFHNTDPYNHVTTLHSGAEIRTFDHNYLADTFRNRDWFDMVIMQTAHMHKLPETNYWKRIYDLTPTVPILEGEFNIDGLWGGSLKEPQTRQAAYISIMNGSFGYSYGAEGVWNATWDTQDKFQVAEGTSPIPWYKALNNPQGQQMTYLKDLFTSLPWWSLAPASNIVKWTGIPTGMSGPSVKASSNKSHILIYYPISTDVTKLNYEGVLTGLNPNHKYDAKWFDTKTGTYSTAVSGFKPNSDGTWKIVSRPTVVIDNMLVIIDQSATSLKACLYNAIKAEKNINTSKSTGEKTLPKVNIVLGDLYKLNPLSKVQGENNWYFKAYNSSTSQYTEMPITNVVKAWNDMNWGEFAYWENSTPSTTGNGAIITGTIQLPGDNTDCVLEWLVPADGIVHVTNRMKLIVPFGATDVSDGVVYSIKNNDKQWFKTDLTPKNIFGQADFTVNVKKGDTIRFIVNKKGVWSESGDQVVVTPIIDFAAN